MKIISEEIQFMLDKLNLPLEIRKKLKKGTKGLQEMTLDEIDLLHDQCGERLQTNGFDENYNLSEEGKILEKLVDKLHDM
jgi:hypothetical protein